MLFVLEQHVADSYLLFPDQSRFQHCCWTGMSCLEMSTHAIKAVHSCLIRAASCLVFGGRRSRSHPTLKSCAQQATPIPRAHSHYHRIDMHHRTMFYSAPSTARMQLLHETTLQYNTTHANTEGLAASIHQRKGCLYKLHTTITA